MTDEAGWVRPVVTIDLEEYNVLKAASSDSAARESILARKILYKMLMTDPLRQNQEIIDTICKEAKIEWARHDLMERVIFKDNKPIKK